MGVETAEQLTLMSLLRVQGATESAVVCEGTGVSPHTGPAKVLEFQLQHHSFQRNPGLISFRMDWLDLLAVQGTLKSLLHTPGP